jgi:hypothetical protein
MSTDELEKFVRLGSAPGSIGSAPQGFRLGDQHWRPIGMPPSLSDSQVSVSTAVA